MQIFHLSIHISSFDDKGFRDFSHGNMSSTDRTEMYQSTGKLLVGRFFNIRYSQSIGDAFVSVFLFGIPDMGIYGIDGSTGAILPLDTKIWRIVDVVVTEQASKMGRPVDMNSVVANFLIFRVNDHWSLSESENRDQLDVFSALVSSCVFRCDVVESQRRGCNKVAAMRAPSD